MAEIRPFQGLRFTPSAGPLDHLVAPPYDVLSEDDRDGYGARSPHNVVHLTLPEQRPDDRSKYIKYARSAAALAEWRREGLLAPDPPSLYRYTQTFEVEHLGGPFTRTSLIALIKAEPYEKGVVLPHEQTFPKHKEDRLRLLEATRAHLECIFGLYEDAAGTVLGAIAKAPAAGRVEVGTADDVNQRLEVIQDQAACRALCSMFEGKKIWIADGHHRYETALAFRAAMGLHAAPIAEDYLIMALSSMSDPGLVLLATHRILKPLSFDPAEALERLGSHFSLEPLHNSRLWPALQAASAEGERVLGLAMPGGRGYLLRAIDRDEVLSLIPAGGSSRLRELDVTVLHGVVLESLLRVSVDDISYTRDPDDAIAAVDQGAPAAFLMNPPTVDDMRHIALGGERMPQKSTYYFPKVLSGLVMWSLADF
ncbi:MAG: DUF1015 domain-containing protein [Fimbriimonas ginsengisoli]|uniref:DUF1015 domain-containing protein n=1 Tax=Fimbriimonas ginsengisoli TaxID=1005039 RepID=A0A931LT19_FIMGI|nr:DUF1015 domain-containing protein [Fimbriimonas ginsengisoli]